MRSCIYEETLQAWFDGELAADEAAKVTAHLNTCVRCAEAARTVEAENLMLSEALATEFAAAVPTERLRQRVEAAVAELHHASVPGIGQSRGQSRWRAAREFFASWRPLAYASIAAAILIAGVLGLVYLRKEPVTPYTAQKTSAEAPPVISQGTTEPPPNPASLLPSKIEKVRKSKPAHRSPASEPEAMTLLWQERQYNYAIARLNEAINIQPPMRPSVQVEYEYNMAVFDSAIASGRDAARKHPEDPQATQFMLAAFQSKIDLMTQIANARDLEK
jgi:negative regulator of sigma E activity